MTRPLITALKAAQRMLENATYDGPHTPPWREGETFKAWDDQRKEALSTITSQIIDAQAAEIDPAEQSEFYAFRTDPDHYLTDEEERQFQLRIARQVEDGYYDDDGGWNEGLGGHNPWGPCLTCGHPDVCEEEYTRVTSAGVECWTGAPWLACEHCLADVAGFLAFTFHFVNEACICGEPEECDPYQAWRTHERPADNGGVEHLVASNTWVLTPGSVPTSEGANA